jgi:FkbM family methyltransferase
MKPLEDNLIYDVGLYDGADTQYYLFRGFRVVAIDANPIMIEKARVKFAREIEQGRLILLNVGISDTVGSADFWISAIPEWSSFDPSIAGRDGVVHDSIPVLCRPFGEILDEYGSPYYLKIDIEGNDEKCLRDLHGRTLPAFVSVEAECLGDAEASPGQTPIDTLWLLRDAGYSRFKLVNQRRKWSAVRANPSWNWVVRMLTSAKAERWTGGAIHPVADLFTGAGRGRRMGFPFALGSSGPWGDDVPGPWLSFDQARCVYLRERSDFFAHQRAAYSFWYDWHAAR